MEKQVGLPPFSISIRIEGLEEIKKKTYTQMLLLETWSQLFEMDETEVKTSHFDDNFFVGLSQFLREMASKSSETYEWLSSIRVP